MAKDLDIGLRSFASSYFNDQNKEQPMFNLDKELTLTLISGYNVKLRNAIIRRWQELEKPIELSRMDILKIAMDAEQENLKLTAQVEDMKPVVVAFERIAKADGSMCLRDAAKNLQIKLKDFTSWLHANDWIYKNKNQKSWIGYSTKDKQGLLEHKVTTVGMKDGNEMNATQVRITAKGLAKLSGLLNDEEAA